MPKKKSPKRGRDPARVALQWAVKALDARDAYIAHNDKPTPVFGKVGRGAYWTRLSKLRARMEFTGKRHIEAVRAYIAVTRLCEGEDFVSRVAGRGRGAK